MGKKSLKKNREEGKCTKERKKPEDKNIRAVQGTQEPNNSKLKKERNLSKSNKTNQTLKRSHSQEEADGIFPKKLKNVQACKKQYLEPKKTNLFTEKQTQQLKNGSKSEKKNQRKNSKKSKKKKSLKKSRKEGGNH